MIYGLNDTKRIKKKEVILILYSFTPSDMNFQTNLMPKVILEKSWSQNVYSLVPFLSKVCLVLRSFSTHFIPCIGSIFLALFGYFYRKQAKKSAVELDLYMLYKVCFCDNTDSGHSFHIFLVFQP